MERTRNQSNQSSERRPNKGPIDLLLNSECLSSIIHDVENYRGRSVEDNLRKFRELQRGTPVFPSKENLILIYRDPIDIEVNMEGILDGVRRDLGINNQCLVPIDRKNSLRDTFLDRFDQIRSFFCNL